MKARFTTMSVGNRPPGRHPQLHANQTVIRHHDRYIPRHVGEMRTWLVGTRPRLREINPVLIPSETEVNPSTVRIADGKFGVT
jgi:hypothetical protein